MDSGPAPAYIRLKSYLEEGEIMRRNFVVIGMVVFLSACAVLWLLQTPTTQAKGKNWSNWEVGGTWASQLTGSVMFPAEFPGASVNGSYCLNGRVEADGFGNVQGTVYDNYNGMLLNYTWRGTYQVNPDGTMTVETTIDFMGNPYHLTMFGVICDKGDQIRLTQIGPTMGEMGVSEMFGLPDNFLGSTVVGSWIRQ
jgi:hypothetical protein